METYRWDNPVDGSGGHFLSFRLTNQRHAQVLHIEHHSLQQSLLSVRPVLWKLYKNKEQTLFKHEQITTNYEQTNTKGS